MQYKDLKQHNLTFQAKIKKFIFSLCFWIQIHFFLDDSLFKIYYGGLQLYVSSQHHIVCELLFNKKPKKKLQKTFVTTAIFAQI